MLAITKVGDNINKVLHHAIFLGRNAMSIINQLPWFCSLLNLRIQCFASRVMFIVSLTIFLLVIILSYTVFPLLFRRYGYNAYYLSEIVLFQWQDV